MARIKVSEARELERMNCINYISTKFAFSGERRQCTYYSLAEALARESDENRCMSFWLTMTNEVGFYELTDENGNVL